MTTKPLPESEREDLADFLEGKTIVSVKVTDSSLRLVLDDRTTIEAVANDGMDGRTGTEISVNGVPIVHK